MGSTLIAVHQNSYKRQCAFRVELQMEKVTVIMNRYRWTQVNRYLIIIWTTSKQTANLTFPYTKPISSAISPSSRRQQIQNKYVTQYYKMSRKSHTIECHKTLPKALNLQNTVFENFAFLESIIRCIYKISNLNLFCCF